MNKELKAQWLWKLRSGQYQQGQNLMYCQQQNTYCCLGVLRECLPKDVQALNVVQLGMEEAAVVELSIDEQAQLINRNDGAKGLSQHSFPQIAEWIEENL